MTNDARECRPPDMKLAYIMSRFPKLSETFILREMVEIKQRGVDLEVFPLIKQHESVSHDDVRRLDSDVHYTSLLSPVAWLTNLLYLLMHPVRYVGAIYEVIVRTFGAWELLFKTLALFPKAVRIAHLMRKRGVTHVHAHFATYPAAAALVAHRLTGVPYSFTSHAHDIHVEQEMLPTKIREAEFSVMISRYNKRFVVETCGRDLEDKMVVIHCGLRMDDYTMKEHEQAPGRPLRIVCVARMTEMKGHIYLVEACRLLHERGIDFVCHLVGDGPLFGRIQETISRSGLRSAFVLHGALPMDHTARRVAASDVMALTSVQTARGEREGIPVSLMEAMAAGLPVVATDYSGIPELVEHGRTGLLVPPRAPEAIADALETLGDSARLRREFGRAGHEKVAREFNIERSVDRLLDLWREAHSRS